MSNVMLVKSVGSLESEDIIMLSSSKELIEEANLDFK